MKKLLVLIFLLMGIFVVGHAQAPQKMSYQAVARDAHSNILISQPVGIRCSILQGSSTGSAVYVETHQVSTNVNGLATLEIGGGTVVSGTFATIDWGAGPFFLKTEIDPTGGTSYTLTNVEQMLSVPYALYAKNAGGNVQSDWNVTDATSDAYIQNKPTIPTTTGDLTNNSGFITAAGVPAAQVQSDWDVTDASSAAYIKNKPTIPTNTGDLTNNSGFITAAGVPAAQVQSNWNETDNTKPAFIQNKPTIPTTTGDLTNNSGFITAAGVPAAQVQSNWNETDNTKPAFIQNKPSLSAVATSGNYSDLNGTPSLSSVATSGNYSDLTGTPSLSTVATSGNYSDLTGTPSLSSVATSGNYSDLTNKPTIPAAANDATLTIKQNGTSVGTFSANASIDQTINITVPEQVKSDWNATEGAAEILNKPTIPAAANDATLTITKNGTSVGTFSANASENQTINITVPEQVKSDWNATEGAAEILNKPTINDATLTITKNGASVTFSANASENKSIDITVPEQVKSDWNATEGAAEILNKPTIPAAANDATLTITKNGTSVGTFTANASTDQTIDIEVPAQVKSDWNATEGAAEILNKPDLSSYVTTNSAQTITGSKVYYNNQNFINSTTKVASSFDLDKNYEEDGCDYKAVNTCDLFAVFDSLQNRIAALESAIANATPLVTTTKITTSVIEHSAYAYTGGTVVYLGTGTINERGVCYSYSHNPTTSNYKIEDSEHSSGTFTSSFSPSYNEQFYVRAYVIIDGTTYYGNEVSYEITSTGGSQDGDDNDG